MASLCAYYETTYYDCPASELAENETLNREAAEESHLPDGETFTMANFTYANSAVVSRIFEHLQNTMFPGISVSCLASLSCYSKNKQNASYTLFIWSMELQVEKSFL